MKKILLAAAVSAAFGISGVQAAEDLSLIHISEPTRRS